MSQAAAFYNSAVHGMLCLHLTINYNVSQKNQGVYKFNQANFQEIPGGILRKIQDMFALLRPRM